nr:probable inactive receptor kinase At2g26730 [Tanacetum cinerariifolium]
MVVSHLVLSYSFDDKLAIFVDENDIKENFLIGFSVDERNALLALKAGFHNAFLDEKWQSENCYGWFGLKCNGAVVGVTLENLEIRGEIKVDALFNLTALSFLSFKNNLISGQLMDFSNNVNLAQLDLENIAVKYDEEKGEEIPSELPSEIPSQVIDNKAKGTKQDQEDLVFVDGVAEFELGDLMKASAESMGKGNFGNAYRARLDDGRHVTVKRLRDLKPLSRDEFMNRLQVLTAHRHPNLAPPIAYFYSKDEKLLVHKFMENGNLFNRIHGGRGTSDRIPFRWSARLAVARGVGRALEYLHMNPNSQAAVPHGNLKSSNVLIDENNMVLVSDYGMTSIITNTISAQRMVSYRSPEYLASKKVSKKSDVWSYGSLVMELLTGKISSHSAPKDITAVDLCSWVHRAVREEWTAEIFDLEIMVQRSATHGMLKLLQLAVRCCDNSPVKRPEMSEVVREVESIKLPSAESESEEDLSADRSADRSVDRSLTDDSMSATTPSR